MTNYPEGEIKEMIELYTSKGLGLEDATTIVTPCTRHRVAQGRVNPTAMTALTRLLVTFIVTSTLHAASGCPGACKFTR